MRRHSSGPSLRAIATRASVSVAAVSMALRNHPRIPAATRSRIQRLAMELGWKPNPLLAEAMSAIRAGQPVADRVTLAWVTAHSRRDNWKRVPFFRRSYEGAAARAAAAGYRLDHFWLGDADGHASRLSDILVARGIVGVLVAPLPKPTSLALDWSQFSAVAIAYSLTAPRLHRASDNHVASARLAVTSLAATGRRRIGLALNHTFDRRVNGLWTAGYLLQTHDDGRADPVLMHRPVELEEGAFMDWVRRSRTDAIIGTDARVLGWLKRAGVRVPEDIAYADLDISAADGTIAGIYQDAEGIGAAALDLVAGQLLRHERGLPDKPKAVLIESRWAGGATAPEPPHPTLVATPHPDRHHPEWPVEPAVAIARPVSFD
ncbi:MAG: LacI family DNA-binding transcriptional regulator [Opitutaceae bacterium]